MNVLLLGSDIRPDEEEKYGRSDTLMLLHVDPDADYVSVLSLPRDLRVYLNDLHGYQKINAAYAYGGDALAITTVQELTGLKINHFVNVNFDAFRAVTTALGGIYVDVDRRYYYGGARLRARRRAAGLPAHRRRPGARSTSASATTTTTTTGASTGSSASCARPRSRRSSGAWRPRSPAWCRSWPSTSPPI